MSTQYRPEIDGLRALAVLAVLIYHAIPAGAPGGFMGVDVFFVISGYLITSILAAEHANSGQIDLLGFYARRIRRLMPALWTVIAATIVLTLVFAPMGVFAQRVAESATASLLFLANVYFQFASGGYFEGPADELPLLHLWSLGVEEQFYLVHPLLLMLFLRFSRRAALGALVTLAIGSLVLAQVALDRWPDAAFFQMPPRFWELAAGSVLALLPARRLASWWAGFGLALIFAGYAFPPARFPGIGALPAVVGAMLVIAVAHGGTMVPALRLRPLVLVGLWSYPLYLWHWPLLALDRATSLGEPPVERLVLWCALSIVLAALTHRFIETPWRTRLANVPQRRVVLGGVSVIASLVAVVTLTGNVVRTSSDEASVASQDHPALLDTCHFDSWATVTSLRECTSQQGQPTVAVWGDSFALAWQPYAWEVAGERTATMITMSACPPIPDFDLEREDAPGHRENCARMNALALTELSGGQYETVVIAAHWLSQPTEVRASFARSLDQLANVPEVLVMLPLPGLPYPAPRCISSRREGQCERSRAEAEAERAEAVAQLRSMAAARPNVRLIDPLPYFCGETCGVRRHGVVLFWDDDHVSSSAARGFAKWSDAAGSDASRTSAPADRPSSSR